MKNKLLVTLIVVAVFLSVGINSFAQTADDSVGVTITPGGGTVTLLAIVSGGAVALTGADGGWSAPGAGQQPVNGAFSAGAPVDGGYLQYTLYGGSNASKITVETTTSGYVGQSLDLSISTFTYGGTPQTGANEMGSVNSLSLNVLGGAVQDFITTIDGTNFWTGTGASDGARLFYQLDADPTVSTIIVRYTIINA